MNGAGIAAALVVALGSTLGAAQAGGGAPPGAAAPRAETPEQVAVIGCVAPSPAPAGAAAGRTAANGYVLTRARVAGPARPARVFGNSVPAAKPGGSDSTSSVAQPANGVFLLEGENLARHNGNQVRMTGTITPGAAGADTRLRVTSVVTVSSVCSAQ